MESIQRYDIVAAMVERDKDILLARQQGPDDPSPTWALPGGVVEPGELLTEALSREVREETGLLVREVGRLLYVAQFHHPGGRLRGDWAEQRPGYMATAFIFEAIVAEGAIASHDPDGFVLGAEFVALSEAIARLEAHPLRVMREPAVAYLRGGAPVGSVWLYRRASSGADELVARLVSAAPPE